LNVPIESTKSFFNNILFSSPTLLFISNTFWLCCASLCSNILSMKHLRS
jgi:hypothetical protein